MLKPRPRCSCTACSFMVDLLRSQRDAPISARSACHRTAGQVLGANLKCSESSWGARRAHLMISTPRVRQETAAVQNFEPANVRFGLRVQLVTATLLVVYRQGFSNPKVFRGRARDLFPSGNTVAASRWCSRC